MCMFRKHLSYMNIFQIGFFFFYLPENHEVFVLHSAASHYSELSLPFKRRVVSVRTRISLWPTIHSAIFSY